MLGRGDAVLEGTAACVGNFGKASAEPAPYVLIAVFFALECRPMLLDADSATDFVLQNVTVGEKSAWLLAVKSPPRMCSHLVE